MTIIIENVRKYYPVREGKMLSFGMTFLKAVDGVSFMVEEEKTLALIGESGCGKTTIAKLILRLEPPSSGIIRLDGKDIMGFSKIEKRNYHLSVQAVFQNPYASLDPRMKIGDSIAEAIVTNRLMSKREIKDRIVELLSKVGLEARSKDLYPHEFSGGQRQRIAVARALATKPRFVILDEPVSALDVSIRAQIMNLLQELQEDSGIGYLLISHDLTTAIHLSHRVEVIYSGQVVESIPANRIYHGAVHPYTQALLKSASPDQLRKQTEEFVLPGEVPDPLNFPLGCRFHPRCAEKMAKCSLNEPPLQKVTNDHHVRCHLYTH